MTRPIQACGPALRKFREARGMSGKDFAIAAKMSPGHLSELEQGRRNLTDSLVQRIASAVEISVPALLEEIAEISSDLPLPSNEADANKTKDDLTPYRFTPRFHQGQPPDEYRELAMLLIKSTPKADAWKMLRQLTDAAETGDAAAARCARALLNLLSSPEI
jgi:transcriptional regulator with XRE-family HTH domain